VDPTTSGNAGHVNSITNSLNSSRSQIFAYDTLNRITTAGTTATSGTYCWGYQYNYDAWGNLLAQAGWSPNYNSCSEATMGAVTANGKNQISGFTYDAFGNTLNDGTIAYTYDAESQIKTAAGVTYAYDGSGRRVFKSSGKLYWYGSGGEILAETDTSGNTLNEYIFFGGRRVAMLPAGGNAQFYAEDFLGSSRVITTNNGTVCYDADFDPYGGEHPYTNTCSQNYKFEGKERDTETGNDDFGARYYTSRFGRWLSSDWSSVPVAVPYANLTNPQTLNLYAMVSDDPESFADLDGHTNQASYGNSGAGVETCASSGAGASGTTASGCGNNASQTQAQGQQQSETQRQAATSVTVLGNTVKITYSPNMSAQDRLTASDKISDVANLINGNADRLSNTEKASIGNVKEINIDPTASRSSVDVQTGILHENAGQMAQDSARLATDVAHDSFHITQYKSGTAYTGAPAERDATYFQIGVGRKIGLSSSEINKLKDYADHVEDHRNYWNSPVTHPPNE
jgi:RHS repeat-associated protein